MRTTLIILLLLLSVSLSAVTKTAATLSGVLIKELDENANKIRVDEYLKTGEYILKIETDNMIQVKKIIK